MKFFKLLSLTFILVLFAGGINKAKADIANCEIEIGGIYCKKCAVGYTASKGDLSCVATPHCTRHSGSECTACEEGYITTSNRTSCMPLPERCLTGQFGYCIECEEGYMSSKGSGDHCVELPQNCTNGSFGGCNKCIDGYMTSSDRLSCISMPQNCTTGSSGKCTQCITGYFPSSDGLSCISMPQNCTTGSAGKCTRCITGYSPTTDGLGCFECDIANCTKCSADGQSCTTCQTGYSKSNGACVQIDPIEHCARMDGARCMGCESGYSLSSDRYSCVSLPPHCRSGNATSCSQCESGWAVADGVCKKVAENNTCGEGCSTCLEEGYCASCANHYYDIGNGTCDIFIPSEHCTTVSSSNPALCTQCNDGYVLLNSTCIAGSSCPEGYNLSNGKCSRANSNCSSTATGGSCVFCRNDKYLQNGTCVDECAEGYKVTRNTRGSLSCVPSEWGCRSDQISLEDGCADKATECDAGLDLVDGLCVLKTHYTMQEADQATTEGNNNWIEWTFE